MTSDADEQGSNVVPFWWLCGQSGGCGESFVPFSFCCFATDSYEVEHPVLVRRLS